MKLYINVLMCLAVVFSSLAHATTAADTADYIAKQVNTLLTTVPTDALNHMISQEEENLAVLKQSVISIQTSLDEKKVTQKLYSVSLNVQNLSAIIFAVSVVSGASTGIITSIETIFDKDYRAAFAAALKKAPLFQFNKTLESELSAQDYYLFSPGIRRIFKYSLAVGVASYLVADHALSESATLNQDQIRLLEHSLNQLNSDIESQSRFMQFLKAQVAIRDQTK